MKAALRVALMAAATAGAFAGGALTTACHEQPGAMRSGAAAAIPPQALTAAQGVK